MCANEKILLLDLLQILKKYTDESHRLAQHEIIQILNRDYDTFPKRKTVKNNIEKLLRYGEREDGNEILLDKTNNLGYITHKRAMELLQNVIDYCTDNGNVELEIVRRDLYAIGFSDDEIKWLGYDWILEEDE